MPILFRIKSLIPISDRKRCDMKRFVFIIAISITLLLPFSVRGVGTDSATYSVKGRWVVKTSISLYRTWNTGSTVFGTGMRDNGGVGTQRFNFRAEASYAFTRHLEVGLFLGFQNYRYLTYIEPLQPGVVFGEMHNTFAPTFGANVTFQLLPLFRQIGRLPMGFVPVCPIWRMCTAFL